MKVIDVYKQYISAHCIVHDTERKAALVTLTATSENGNIKYEVGVSFFPHRDPEDFAVSYDACGSKELYCAKGRRSKKRDEQFIAEIKPAANSIAADMNGIIYWDKPLTEAQYS